MEAKTWSTKSPFMQEAKIDRNQIGRSVKFCRIIVEGSQLCRRSILSIPKKKKNQFSKFIFSNEMRMFKMQDYQLPISSSTSSLAMNCIHIFHYISLN